MCRCGSSICSTTDLSLSPCLVFRYPIIASRYPGQSSSGRFSETLTTPAPKHSPSILSLRPRGSTACSAHAVACCTASDGVTPKRWIGGLGSLTCGWAPGLRSASSAICCADSTRPVFVFPPCRAYPSRQCVQTDIPPYLTSLPLLVLIPRYSKSENEWAKTYA